MSASAPLLPCPFCGTSERDDEQERGLPAWLQLSEHPGAWSVECYGCGTETRWLDTAEDAAASWNRRAEPTPNPFAGGDSKGRISIEVPSAKLGGSLHVFLRREKNYRLVGAEDGDYHGPTASVSFDETWLTICTDEYEGNASLNVEALPALQQALAEIAAELEAAK